MDLKQLFTEKIASTLKRKSITTPSRWAENYRVISGNKFAGPWSFKHYPWLKEMHDSVSEHNCGMKSSQMGYTETMLNLTFYFIDLKQRDCLYVLPAKNPDASEFSAARFDSALEASPYLDKLFSDVKNVGHKRAGSANLYLRGSRSRSGLKSLPVGLLILDEMDEMDEENIPLARERLTGQFEHLEWNISTPTVEHHGIHGVFELSTQEHYFFKCPSCNRFIELDVNSITVTADSIYDNNVKNSYLKCNKCQARLNHEAKSAYFETAKWVPSVTNRDIRGFYINQLYSPTVTPGDFALGLLQAQQNPANEQIFYNSKMGIPHTVEGASISDLDIDACLKDYRKGPLPGAITMGVDVGKYLHVEIDRWYGNGMCQVINQTKVEHFEDLVNLMIEYNVSFCVIDPDPERRKATEFAAKFPGRVKLCFYRRGIQGKNINVGRDETGNITDDPLITVDRTSWLDLSLSRFRNRTITLPADINQEYRNHIKAQVRRYDKDPDGNPTSKYVSLAEDHYGHARNYAEIAFAFISGGGSLQDISV